MNSRFESHFFWGQHSPISSLAGAALVVLSSGRFAFAILCAGAIVWVYGLSALVFSGAKAIMPARGRIVILLFLSAFFCGIFVMITSLLNPLLLTGAGFFLFLIPPCCMSSGFYETPKSTYTTEVLSRALLEAAGLSGVILALALIREPLGMGTLSFPGGVQGIMEIIDSRKEDSSVWVRFLSASSGALVLVGYGIALFRHFREKSGGTSGEEQ